MADDCRGEDEFVGALLQLQVIHGSILEALKTKLDYQVSVNLKQEEELKQLREKVKRLKAVVSKAKKKITQQALVIRQHDFRNHQSNHTCVTLFESPSIGCEGLESRTESVSLRDDEIPSSSSEDLSNTDVSELSVDMMKVETGSKNGEPGASGSVGLRSRSGSLEETILNPSTHKGGLCHIFYSHAHNTNPTIETPKPTDNENCTNSTISGRLSLKESDHSKVRYKTVVLKTITPDKGDDSDDCYKDDSSPSSPSLLKADTPPARTPAEEEGEDPMSCSMFTNAPHGEPVQREDEYIGSPSLVKTTRHNPKRNSSPRRVKKGNNPSLDQIVQKLKKGTPTSEKTILPKENVESASLDIDEGSEIVPVTPGVKLVKNIILTKKDQWLKAKGVSVFKSLDVPASSTEAGSNVTLKNRYKKATYKPLSSVKGVEDVNSRKRAHPGDTTREIINEDALRVAIKRGLPTNYKYEAKILKHADRDKLDAKPCPDCKKWFENDGGVHDGKQSHLKHVCRHKALHHAPDTEPGIWNISFPNTEDYEQRQ